MKKKTTQPQTKKNPNQKTLLKSILYSYEKKKKSI